MKIIHTLPPGNLYAQIIERWPEVADMPNVIFTYGNAIYNPSGADLPQHIIEHEEVHMHQQQLAGPGWWWDTYLVNDKFRLDQELEAYRVEYRAFCRMYKDRNERNSFLNYQASMLSSPMYGNLISTAEAREKIKI